MKYALTESGILTGEDLGASELDGYSLFAHGTGDVRGLFLVKTDAVHDEDTEHKGVQAHHQQQLALAATRADTAFRIAKDSEGVDRDTLAKLKEKRDKTAEAAKAHRETLTAK